MTDSILILGAAALQIPLIEYVKSQGYRVIVVSIYGNYPGFKLADKCVFCDVRNGDEILKQVENEHIVAVLTDQTDLSVPTVAYVANKLGLPSNSIKVAKSYSNKYLIREVCDQLKLPNLKHIRASELSFAIANWSIFPSVIKPEDNQGSRGVFKLDSKNDLVNHFEESLSFSKTRNVIIEEYFKGKEVVVEGFVYNGQYINFGIGDRYYFKLNNTFIPAQTIFPSNISDNLKAILLNFEETFHHFLMPSFGMVHSEFLVDEINEDVRLVETALRGGGVYISSHLIPLYTGFNNYELLLDCALGEKVDVNNVKNIIESKASAYICFYLNPGRVVAIEGLDSVEKMDGVVLSNVKNIHIGDVINTMTNKTQRLGPIIVTALNRSQLEKLIFNIQQTLHVKVIEQNGNMSDIVWD